MGCQQARRSRSRSLRAADRGWSPKDLNDHKALEIAREQREGERVAYMAATRARDLLVVPAVGDEPYGEGWVSPSTRRFIPPKANAAFSSRPRVVLNFRVRTRCSSGQGRPGVAMDRVSGRTSHRCGWIAHGRVVVARVAGAVTERAGTVRPASRRSDREGRAAGDSPARTRRTPGVGEPGAPTMSAASRASIDVMTATRAASMPELTGVDQVPVTTVSSGSESPRPGGVRFGSLVHTLLADVPFGEKALTCSSGCQTRTAEYSARRTRRSRPQPPLSLRAGSSNPPGGGRAAREGQCFRETPSRTASIPGLLSRATWI